MNLEGTLVGTEIPAAGFAPGVDTGSEVVLLDPRAIIDIALPEPVRGRTEARVYHPRQVAYVGPDDLTIVLADWVHEWLRENPEW
jgi:hypothetical protein